LRQTIDKAPPKSPFALWARWVLSENLYDVEQYAAAADVRKGVIEALDDDADGAVRAAVERFQEAPAVRSRWHFYLACAHQAAGRVDDQREELQRGIEQDPKDGDVLIALYRLSADSPERRQHTLEMIQNAVGEFRKDIEASPEDYANYNQLAWLVANTQGDFDEAVRMSLKSIEVLRAMHLYDSSSAAIGGLLDTLAHCYYGKADYANAVKHQTEAARLDPGSQQIARKLAVFREALAAQQSPAK